MHKFHKVARLGSGRTPDGAMGAVEFVLADPASNNGQSILLAFEDGMLPNLALKALAALPQPKGAHSPAVLPTKSLAIGVGRNGETALMVELQPLGTVAFYVSEEQLSSLHQALGVMLNHASKGPQSPGRLN